MEAILKAILETNNVLIALLSGFFGAVITAVFSYIVSAKLATREHNKRKKRVAFIYLVKISQIVAGELALKDFIALKFKENNPFTELKKEIKSISSTLELAHAFCAALGKAFVQNNEIVKEIQKYTTFFDAVEQHFSEYYDFKIPDDILAQFPRDAISHYSRFISNVMGIRTAFLQWSAWAKTGDGKLLDAEKLFAQYWTFKNLLESAHKLRDVLIAKGGVSIMEAETLLKEQKKKMSETFIQISYANTVMPLLSQIIFKSMEKPLAGLKKVNENVTTPELSSTTSPPPPSAQN